MKRRWKENRPTVVSLKAASRTPLRPAAAVNAANFQQRSRPVFPLASDRRSSWHLPPKLDSLRRWSSHQSKRQQGNRSRRPIAETSSRLLCGPLSSSPGLRRFGGMQRCDGGVDRLQRLCVVSPPHHDVDVGMAEVFGQLRFDLPIDGHSTYQRCRRSLCSVGALRVGDALVSTPDGDRPRGANQQRG